jgi:hypothetical protein
MAAMIVRGLVVWLLILILAILNGAARDGLMTPVLGDTLARAISTLILCGLIAGVSWGTIGWVGPASRRDAWLIGILWLSMTLGFEFLAGHYLFGKPWSELLADYDVRRGRIWILVLIVVLVAPRWPMGRAGRVGR